MEKNYEEVKKSIYIGMSIFNILKDYELNLGNENISLEDKKYLSLYLGIINSKNKISLYLKEKEAKFSFNVTYRLLKQDDYINIYNLYFVDIIKEINFNSIEKHFDYLLEKKVIKDFNRYNGHYVDKTVNDRNKQLIKTIN